MNPTKDKSIEGFVNELASSAPTPGGGGAAALAGALAAALGHMVGSLTVGKKKYADVQDEIRSLNLRLENLQSIQLQMIDEDARVFAPLAQAYGLPRATEAEKIERDRLMEEALQLACTAPVSLLEELGRVVTALERMGEIGTALAISDVAVAAAFARAGLEAAALNVYINTRLMKNQERAEQIEAACDRQVAEYLPRAEALYLGIRSRLRQKNS